MNFAIQMLSLFTYGNTIAFRVIRKGRFFVSGKRPLIFATVLLLVCGLYIIDRNWGNNHITDEEPLPYHLDGNGTRECLCGDEMMCLLVHPVLGRQFDCRLLPYLKRFKLRDADAANTTTVDNIRPDQVTFVTYSSGNHFAQSRLMIVRLREKLSNRIIYYDLGLSRSQISELDSVCNLEVRRLNYSSLPPHIRHIKKYAWKVVIVAELISELPYFLTMDASIMLKNVSALNEFFEAANRGKVEDVALRYNSGQKHDKYTHPVMFEYLPMPLPIRLTEYQMGATIMFIRHSPFTKRVWKWVLLCALTQHCISPPHAVAECSGSPRGCHRFDQSAVNLALRGQMGFQPKEVLLGVFDKFMDVERETGLSEFPSITCS